MKRATVSSQGKPQAPSASLFAGRVPIVVVSSSADDARTFREIADATGRMIINVPDLAAAQAVIRKLCPGVVLCDTEIEGPGSWRDLLEESESSYELIVISPDPDENLWAEVLSLGAFDLVARPFRPEEVRRVLAFALLRSEEQDQ